MSKKSMKIHENGSKRAKKAQKIEKTKGFSMKTRDDYVKLKGNEKKEATKELYETIKEALEGNEEGTNAMKILRPSLYGIASPIGRNAGPSKRDLFVGMFSGVGSAIDEMDLYREMRLGRRDAKDLIRDHIRKADPAEIKWITFDPQEEAYKMVGEGPNPPEDWTGPLPQSYMENEALDETYSDDADDDEEL